jgi:hypothetical protein
MGGSPHPPIAVEDGVASSPLCPLAEGLHLNPPSTSLFSIFFFFALCQVEVALKYTPSYFIETKERFDNKGYLE